MKVSEQQELMLNTIIEIYNTIHNEAKKYSGQKKSEIGLVKKTFLVLIERVGRTMEGIISLMEHNKDVLEYNRQPIMLLFRSIIEDLMVSTHLSNFVSDLVSFQNELNVINVDYINFSKFLITNEYYFEFSNPKYQGKSMDERKEISEKKMKEHLEIYSSFYKEQIGNYKIKKAGELRETSQEKFFLYKNIEGEDLNFKKDRFSLGKIYEILKGIAVSSNSEQLRQTAFSYLIYRTLSQYEHFTLDVSENVLNRNVEFELGIIHSSIRQIILMMMPFFIILEMKPKELDKFHKLIDKFIGDFEK